MRCTLLFGCCLMGRELLLRRLLIERELFFEREMLYDGCLMRRELLSRCRLGGDQLRLRRLCGRLRSCQHLCLLRARRSDRLCNRLCDRHLLLLLRLCHGGGDRRFRRGKHRSLLGDLSL